MQKERKSDENINEVKKENIKEEENTKDKEKEKCSDKKIEVKEEEKKELSEKEIIDSLNDKLLRQMAEFENYRKRSEKEKAVMFEMGVRDTISKLLPIIDNFERGLKTNDKESNEGFIDGMNMIYAQIMKMFEDIGVVKIKALNEKFDPNLHDAIMHEEDEKDERKGIVIEELLPGYKLKDNLIRPSMVKTIN